MGKRIRLATRDDAAGIAAIYGPIVEETTISFEETAPPHNEFAERIDTVTAAHPWLVLEGDGDDADHTDDGKATIDGYAYASLYRERKAYQWSCEVTVYIAEAARGQGAGRRLYGALFEIIARQGYRQAFAGITLPNAASVGLHTALGFKLVGEYCDVGFKFDAWHDVGWYQRSVSKGNAAPKAILGIEEVCRDLNWAAF